MERLLELTFVLGIEAQKELFKSVRFGELIVQITDNYHKGVCSRLVKGAEAGLF